MKMKHIWLISKGFVCGVLAAAMTALFGSICYILLHIVYYILLQAGLMNFFNYLFNYPVNFKEFGQLLLFIGAVAMMVSLLLSSVIGLVIGIPMYLYSLKTGHTNLKVYFKFGILIAMIVIVIAVFTHVFFDFLIKSDLLLLTGSVLVGSPAAASVFWAVVRPDKISL